MPHAESCHANSCHAKFMPHVSHVMPTSCLMFLHAASIFFMRVHAILEKNHVFMPIFCKLHVCHDDFVRNFMFFMPFFPKIHVCHAIFLENSCLSCHFSRKFMFVMPFFPKIHVCHASFFENSCLSCHFITKLHVVLPQQFFSHPGSKLH